MNKATYNNFILTILLYFYFSPIGEIFRSRLRQFPSFVNCCTIDWFSEWPEEALRSVATNFIQDIPEVDNSDIIPGLVNICVSIHQSVARKSETFLAELSRHNYVTPTSYLELLSMFAKMCRTKKTEISGQRDRTKTGLDKVCDRLSWCALQSLC
jgi:dynein heavy chain